MNPKPTMNTFSEHPPVPEIDLKALYHILRQRWQVVLACFAATIVLALAYSLVATKKYAATATIKIPEQTQKVVDFDGVESGDLHTLESLRTVEQSFTSSELLEQVIKINHLDQNPIFLKHVHAAPGHDTPAMDSMVTYFSEKLLKATVRKGTRLIDVTVKFPDPDMAARLANSVVDEFKKRTMAEDTAEAQTANDFLLDESTQLRKKLQESEQSLQAYREETKAVSLEDQQNVVASQLKELGTSVTEARATLIQGATAYQQVTASSNNVETLAKLTVVATAPQVAALKTQLDQQQNAFANLIQRYKSKNPKYIAAYSQLTDMEARYSNAVLTVAQSVRLAYENARAAEQASESALHEQETEALKLDKLAIQYNALSREVESDQALYESVLTRLKQTSTVKDMHVNNVTSIQTAETQYTPVWPKPAWILLAAIFLGLGFGSIVALALHTFDGSVQSVDDLEHKTGQPVLAIIPQMRGVKAKQPLLVVENNSQPAAAEAFRTLRTQIATLTKNKPCKTIMFTSALPGEGKTMTAVNYALSLAQQGLNCIIIDGDLRRPMVRETLTGQRTPTAGVVDFLRREKKLSEIIQRTETKNLCYVSAGNVAANPAELLLAQKNFNSLIEEASQIFDRVIIDTAPIHIVSDALLMLEDVQMVCLVVHACKTPMRAVQRACHTLKQAGAPLQGAVLNRTPDQRGMAGYDAYYSYYGAAKDRYDQTGVYGSNPAKP